VVRPGNGSDHRPRGAVRVTPLVVAFGPTGAVSHPHQLFSASGAGGLPGRRPIRIVEVTASISVELTGILEFRVRVKQ